jgi:hypothetical protein
MEESGPHDGSMKFILSSLPVTLTSYKYDLVPKENRTQWDATLFLTGIPLDADLAKLVEALRWVATGAIPRIYFAFDRESKLPDGGILFTDSTFITRRLKDILGHHNVRYSVVSTKRKNKILMSASYYKPTTE